MYLITVVCTNTQGGGWACSWLSRSSEETGRYCDLIWASCYVRTAKWQWDKPERRGAQTSVRQQTFLTVVFQSCLQSLSCPFFIHPFPSSASSLVWQLCNWTRRGPNAHQKFCHMQHKDSSVCLSWSLETHRFREGCRSSPLIPHPVQYLSLPLDRRIIPAGILPCSGNPHLCFQPMVLICHICCIPPSVAHCLPLPAPVTSRPVVCVVFYWNTLSKEASLSKYAATFEQRSELWPAHSWVPTSHCVSWGGCL